MSLKTSNTATVYSLAALVIGMALLTYASVPLYRLFCQTTGFGGATRRGAETSHTVLNRTITVRFNTDIDAALPWEFRPLQPSVRVKVGENALAYFMAHNLSNQPVTGNAVFNVIPHKAGPYFVKIQCFCFEEQRLQPGEKVNMPVSFYIDPSMAKDRNLDDVSTITLSYTFFRVSN